MQVTIIADFKTIANKPDNEPLHPALAVHALNFLREVFQKIQKEWKQVPEKISVPGIPEHERELHSMEWTAGLFRKALEARAKALNMTPQVLVRYCSNYGSDKLKQVFNMGADADKMRKKWQMLVRSEMAARMLLPHYLVDKVSRYENSLRRSFFNTLREIERLQSTRSGAAIQASVAGNLGNVVPNESAVNGGGLGTSQAQ